MVFHPALQLVLFNGTPETRKMVLETADGFLAHYHRDGNGKSTMHLQRELPYERGSAERQRGVVRAVGGVSLDRRQEVPRAVRRRSARSRCGQINADALDILKVRDTWGKELLQRRGRPTRNDSGKLERDNQLHLPGSSRATRTI